MELESKVADSATDSSTDGTFQREDGKKGRPPPCFTKPCFNRRDITSAESTGMVPTNDESTSVTYL